MEDVCDFIHVKRNGFDGTAYPLTRHSELVLGRSESCDFRVQVPSACDRHAKLRVDKAGKVYVSSLVPTVPVSLNGEQVLKETFIANKGVITVGSCNFKFVYRKGFEASPLKEDNRLATSAGKSRKSLGTSKSASKGDKENSPCRKSLSRTPCNTPESSFQPDTPTVGMKTPATHSPRKYATPISAKRTGSSAKVPRPSTPISISGSKKKSRVATPMAPPSRRSSTQSSRSSLLSISEEEPIPPASVKKTPASDKSTDSVTPSSGKPKRVLTPTLPRRHSSRSRASSMSITSLMSIQEEDESIAVSPSPLADRKRSQHGFHASTATTSRWSVDVSTNTSKRAARKSVSFGPVLSPEVFNKRLPPSTPVHTGTAPGGLRRSLPANFANPKVLELVTEEKEEEEVGEEEEGEGEVEEEEGEGEMVEYSMTGFEETLSEEYSENSEEEESSEKESEVDDELEDTFVASSPVKRRALPTPLRQQINLRPSLRQRHRRLVTPLRRAIEGRPQLRATRRTMPTPLRKAIKEKPALRKTRRALPTPIRSGIQNHTGLRKTRKTLNTPLHKQIQSMPKLRKTKRCMPTPLRRAIEQQPPLRRTKKAMPTPLRKAIEERPALQKTKRALATPVRKEIESKPALRKAMKSMPTPIRSEIEGRPTLRKTRRALATPVRKEIEGMPKLRQTKKLLPSPIRREIQCRPTLRKTKQTLPTPVRVDIQSRPQLHKTKRSLPTPLRLALEMEHVLRKTKRTLPANLLIEIASKPQLRPTKQKMPTPLREEIQRGVKLRATLHSFPQPAASSRSKRVYTETIMACETPVPAPPAKRRKVAITPLPYNFESDMQPAGNTPNMFTSQPPTKRSKRDYAKTVTSFETPVPVPPAKKIKVAGSPALPTPLPYNFEAFVQPSKSTPNVDLSGLPHLFKLPRVCNSADPSDVFEVRLFGGSREVSFASPLALSAKKPTSRPNSALHPCLKNTEQCLFNIGTAEPRQQKRSQPKRTRKSTKSASTATMTTRVTRSQAKKEVPPSEPTAKRGGRNAVENSDKENISSPPPKRAIRSTRSRAATQDTPQLMSIHLAMTPVATQRHTRSMKMDTSAPQEAVSTHTVSTRSTRKARVCVEDVSTSTVISTRTRNQKSKINSDEKQAPTGATVQQVKGQANDVVRPSTRRTIQAMKSGLAAVVATNERSLRHSHRQGPAPVQQDEGSGSQGKKSSSQKKQQAMEMEVSEKDMGEAVQQPTRRTRQAAKQAQVVAVEKQEVTVKPNTQSSREKRGKDTSAVPMRRSSRLRK